VPGVGEVLVQLAVAGVDFMDIGVRQGMAWRDVPLPRVLGGEGAGRVIGLGAGVTGFALGQRVAWAYAPGSYAEQIKLPAASLVAIPDDIDDRSAAAIMLQGLTASHFATDFYPIQPGDIAIVHAAAGGVGLLLTQISDCAAAASSAASRRPPGRRWPRRPAPGMSSSTPMASSPTRRCA
jgi:NADPH2:quinone reductase